MASTTWKDPWTKGFERSSSWKTLNERTTTSGVGTNGRSLVTNKKGKGKYLCACDHQWSSLNGQVIMTYELDETSWTGTVQLRVLGQQCNKCNGKYEKPFFFDEEVDRIIDQLSVKLGQKFYGDFVPPTQSFSRVDSRMRGQHDSSRCEGCKLGNCRFKVNWNHRGRHTNNGRGSSGNNQTHVIRWVIVFDETSE